MSERHLLARIAPKVLSALVLCPGVAHAESYWFALPGPHFTYRVCCGGGESKVRFGGELSIMRLGSVPPIAGGFLQITPVGPGGGPLVALGAQGNFILGAEAGLALWGGGEQSAGGAGFFVTPHASIALAFFGVRFTFPGAAVDGTAPVADIDLVWGGKIPIPIGFSYGDWLRSTGSGRPVLVEGESVVASLVEGAWEREEPTSPAPGATRALPLRERLLAAMKALPPQPDASSAQAMRPLVARSPH